LQNEFSETVAALRCKGRYAFSVRSVSAALREGLDSLGFHVDSVDILDPTELVLFCGEFILSICRVDELDHHILIAAESPRGAEDGNESLLEKKRLLLCAGATRLVCEGLQVTSVSWWHAGEYYVTDPGRNFAPLAGADAAETKAPQKGARSVLAAVAGGLRLKGSFLDRAIHRHFPSDTDVKLVSSRRH
jgi:hypothetical protein